MADHQSDLQPIPKGKFLAPEKGNLQRRINSTTTLTNEFFVGLLTQTIFTNQIRTKNIDFTTQDTKASQKTC
jgi:hypothetical protein